MIDTVELMRKVGNIRILTSRLVDDVLVGNVVHQSVCSAGRAAPLLIHGDIALDPAAHGVTLAGQPVERRGPIEV